MSANLTKIGEKVQFVSGNNIVPWHKTGIVVPGQMTAAQAMELAGADYEAKEQPIQISGSWLHKGERVHGKKIEGHKAIVRADNGAILGIHSSKYELVQFGEFGHFIDKIISEGQLTWDTCGLMGDNGEMFFASLMVPGHLFIDTPRGQEKHERRIMVLNSHNGKYAPQCMFVSVRPVCQNTVNAALGTRKNRVAVKHTKNWEKNKEEIAKTLKLASAYFDNLNAVMNELAKETVSAQQIEVFTARLFPEKEKTDRKTGETTVELSTRSENLRNSIKALIVEGTGNYGETRLDCLNGVSEFVDHRQTRREGSNELESILLTNGLNLKQRAIDILQNDPLTVN